MGHKFASMCNVRVYGDGAGSRKSTAIMTETGEGSVFLKICSCAVLYYALYNNNKI